MERHMVIRQQEQKGKYKTYRKQQTSNNCGKLEKRNSMGNKGKPVQGKSKEG